MALSDGELKAVKDTWSLVKQDLPGHGLSFYLRLFQKYPEHKDKFAYVRGLKEDVYKESSGLKAQAIKTMKAIDGLMALLGDKNTIIETLSDLAKMHQAIGVSEVEFATFKSPFLETLRAGLGAHFTADAENGYTKLSDFIIETVSSFY